MFPLHMFPSGHTSDQHQCSLVSRLLRRFVKLFTAERLLVLPGSACMVFGMEPAHRALLRHHRQKISDELLVSESIVQFLYQQEILSQDQVEVIESQPSSKRKCLKMLDFLPCCGPRAFSYFLQSLDDFEWVRDELLLELQRGAAAGGEPGATGVSTPSSLTSSHCFCSNSIISVARQLPHCPMGRLEKPEPASHLPFTSLFHCVVRAFLLLSI